MMTTPERTAKHRLQAALFATCLLSGTGGCRPEAEPVESSLVRQSDLADHPLYSTYTFGQDDSVIDIGIQPLVVVNGAIGELFLRDTVLTEALETAGYSIRIHRFLKGDDINFFLESGDLEVGLAGNLPAIRATGSLDVVVPALLLLGYTSVVAKKRMPLAELRGKRIAYPFGSNAHYALLRALDDAGLAESDVRLVNLDVPEVAEALESGEIDAFSAWEPTPTIATRRFPGQVVIHRSQSSGYLYFSRSFAASHREAMLQVVAAEVRGLEWMQRGADNLRLAAAWAMSAATAFIGVEVGLTAMDYIDVLKEELAGVPRPPKVPPSFLADGGRLQSILAFVKELGHLPDTVSWEQVRVAFDTLIIDEVIARREEFGLDTYAYVAMAERADGN